MTKTQYSVPGSIEICVYDINILHYLHHHWSPHKDPCKIPDLFIYQWNCLNIYHSLPTTFI